MADLAEQLDSVAAYAASDSAADSRSMLRDLLGAVTSVIAPRQGEYLPHAETEKVAVAIEAPAIEVPAIEVPASSAAEPLAATANAAEAEYAPMYYI